MSEWRSVKTDPPPIGEEVLTKMKHGHISGFLDESDPYGRTFYGYYWREMEWWSDWWQPLPEPPNAGGES